MLVASLLPFLDAGQVEERLGELVAVRRLSPVDLLPGLGPKRNVVPESDVTRADRVEDPACLSLDRFRDQRNTPRMTRAA